MFDVFAGLPVHIMVIHAVVVLIPLSALGAILIAVRPKALRLFGATTIIGAAVGAVAAFIAKESGEQLATRVGYPQPHTDYGDIFPLYASIYLVVVTGFWFFARGIPLNRNRPVWLKVFGAVVIVAAIAITYFTIITGHTGSEATWQEISQTNPQGSFQREN
jgi:hypothetical protein